MFDPATVDEYLRTFSGREGVLGAQGVYRAAFTTMEQTAPLTQRKVSVPIVTLGGAQGLGAQVSAMVEQVAVVTESTVIAGCGHFLPEECPEEIVRQVRALTMRTR